MRRVIALGLWLCLTWVATGGSAEASTSEATTWIAPAMAQACCKVCHAGKACGNSCISRDKQCHQPPGCACDG